MPDGVGAFRLSITRALATQLGEQLDTLAPVPLTHERVARLHARRASTSLVWGNRVYVGKSANSVPLRLAKHLRKLKGRLNLDAADVEFKCLYVDNDLDAASPERMLINRYREEWTSSWTPTVWAERDRPAPGFRNPGAQPLRCHLSDQSIKVEIGTAIRSVGDLLQAAKKQLPSNLRHSGGNRRHRDYSTPVELGNNAELPFREVPSIVMRKLPTGWQFTFFPG